MASEITSSTLVDPTPYHLRKRYLLVFLAFWGYVNMYALRVNLSVGIVAMTENRTIIDEEESERYEQDFDWNSKEKGFALGAFFYGYIMTQILGGIAANKFGGHLVFGLGIFGTAVMNLLTPVMCNFGGISLLITSRVLQGIFSGIAFPAIHGVYSKWSPSWERSRFASFGISGIYVGTILANSLGGWLCDKIGWESIFYVFGGATMVWYAAWTLIIKPDPMNDLWISESEKWFIAESLKNQNVQKKTGKIPWKGIFTSVPIYAIFVTHFCYTWGQYTILTQLPMYISDVLKFDLTTTGYLSSLPYTLQAILAFFTGYLADLFQVKKILTTTQVRKYFNGVALMTQMGFLLIAAFIPNTTAIIACISISVGAGALAMGGYLPNCIDVAPQFSSIILGVSNTFANIPGLISPPLSGYIAQTPNAEEYRIIFLISCGIYIIGVVVYGLFASAEIQPWAKEKDERKQESEKY